MKPFQNATFWGLWSHVRSRADLTKPRLFNGGLRDESSACTKKEPIHREKSERDIYQYQLKSFDIIYPPKYLEVEQKAAKWFKTKTSSDPVFEDSIRHCISTTNFSSKVWKLVSCSKYMVKSTKYFNAPTHFSPTLSKLLNFSRLKNLEAFNRAHRWTGFVGREFPPKTSREARLGEATIFF